MAEYIKKCEYCGKEFVTKRCDTMFCCKKCGFKQWYEQNKEYNKEYRKQRYEQNKEYRKEYSKEYSKTKYNSDLQFKLSQWSRRQVWRCLSSNKTKRTFDILGYTTEQLKQRLEMNFKPDMNWSNHGTLWHIDHRKPLCKFNLTLPDGTPNYEQIRLANSLANLQPLYITENLSKNGKFELPTTKSLKVINC